MDKPIKLAILWQQLYFLNWMGRSYLGAPKEQKKNLIFAS